MNVHNNEAGRAVSPPIYGTIEWRFVRVYIQNTNTRLKKFFFLRICMPIIL
jgi:hypothetical protein